jgi:membrane fusion protein, multidrug efflux system
VSNTHNKIKSGKIFHRIKIVMKNIIMLMGLYALLFHTSCSKKEEEKEEKTKFLVTSAVKMDTSIIKDYVCQIHSISHIELRAQERGYLQKIYVDEGQLVKEGQLLFQIMPNLYEAELESKKAETKFAEIEYQNTKSLADSNVVAPNELAMAKAKFDKAKAELSLSRVHLQFTQIRAPFNGIIDRFQVRLGSLLDEGDLLTTLSDNSKMWVYFNVPEAEYLDYKSKVKKDSTIKVELLMANNKLFSHSGVVETIEADFNNETGNISFRATFPNPEGLLRHGETGNIQIRQPLKNALLIPQKATFEVLDKKYVFVVDKDNVLRSREITISAEMPHLYVLQGGLTENDRILLEGLRLVRENEKIDCNFIEPRSVMSHLDLYAE